MVGGVVAFKFRLGPHCRGSVHLHGRVAMLISGELVVGEVTSDVECSGWDDVVSVKCWTLVGGRAIALPLGLTDSLQLGASIELQQQGISHIADTVPTGPPMCPVPPWSLPDAGAAPTPELVRWPFSH